MNLCKKTTLLVFFLFHSFLSAQTLTGTVQDTLKAPLPNANVIAKPKQAQAKIKFAIADYLGRYRLELEKHTDYEVKVSYIGYKEQTFHYEHQNPVKSFDFVLKSTGEQLKEIVITHL